MNMKIALAAFVSVALTACATQEPLPTTTLKTEEVVTVDAVKKSYKPIRLHRDDRLTTRTLGRVTAHNNVYWCNNPEQQPPEFDAAICETDFDSES